MSIFALILDIGFFYLLIVPNDDDVICHIDRLREKLRLANSITTAQFGIQMFKNCNSEDTSKGIIIFYAVFSIKIKI